MNNFEMIERESKIPLMTYGLCDCTAVVIVTKDNIILGHYDSTYMIEELINMFEKKTKYILIVSPIEYVQINNKWTEKVKYQKLHKFAVIRGYSTWVDVSNPIQGKLAACIKNKDILITDDYGVWEKIELN